MRFQMRKVKLKQSGVLSIFIDGLVNLSLICPWLKEIINQFVDYYRLDIVKNGHGKRLFGSPVQNYLCNNCYRQFCENIFHRFYRYKYPVIFILLSLDLKKRGTYLWAEGNDNYSLSSQRMLFQKKIK